ncbi:MAG: hypothetical protein OYH77_00110 [Pseudomonadota bacterium]|nr:hypothetical protein [Pseudomonadota bacterium]
MGRKITLLWLLCASSWLAAEEREIATGERYEFKDRGMSLVPPQGFWIQTKQSGFLNFSEPPPKRSKDNISYRRNFQVYWNDGFRYIDDTSAQEFKELLPSKFQKFGGVKDYATSDPEVVDLGAKKKGILFYNTYMIGDAEMIHIVLIRSSKSAHYVITFTDLRSNFEKNSNNEAYASLWWDCFTSVELDSKAPIRYQKLVIAGVALAVLLLFSFIFILFRNRFASKHYDDFADESVDKQSLVELVDNADYGKDTDSEMGEDDEQPDSEMGSDEDAPPDSEMDSGVDDIDFDDDDDNKRS